MGRRRNAVLSAVLAASLALRLFPAPAIAEAVDLAVEDGFEEVVVSEGADDASEDATLEDLAADASLDAAPTDGEGDWVEEAEPEVIGASTEAAPDEGQADELTVPEDESSEPVEGQEEAPAASSQEEQPQTVPTKTLELEKQLMATAKDGEELPDHLEFKALEDGTYSFVVRSEKPTSGKLLTPTDGAQAINELGEDSLLSEEKNEGELHAWAITKELKKDQTVWLAVAGEEYTAEVWKGEPKDFSRVTVAVNAEPAAAEDDEQLAEDASEQPEETADPQPEPVTLAALTVGVTDEDGASLEEGKDYEFVGYLDADGNELDEVPTQAGEYEVMLRGMGLWLGESSAKFALASAPAEEVQPAAETEDPAEQEDSLESAALTDISKAYLYIYRDYYRRSDWADVCFYTGTAVEPRVSVNCEGRDLTQDTDYTVTYANNTKVGTATVTIKGIGSYTGSMSDTFVIVKSAEISDYVYERSPYITYDGSTTAFYSSTVLEYLGTGNAVMPSVSFDSPYGGSEVMTPKSGKDFSVTYKDASGKAVAKPTKAGSYKIVMTGISGGLLTGTYEIPFTIVSKLDLSRNGTVNFDDYDFYDSGYTYIRTGSSVVPQIRVRAMEKVLTEGTDYTVKLSNNTKAGTASVTVTGKGDYTGSLTRSFTIVDSVELSTYAKNVTPRVTANGVTTYVYSSTNLEYLCIDEEPVCPSVSFSSYGFSSDTKATAVQGKDFTVSYTNSSGKTVASPTATGNYKIVLTAKSGSFLTGTYEIPFTIIKSVNLGEKGSASLSYNGEYASTNGTYTIYDDIDATTAKNLQWSVSASGRSLIENYDYTKGVSQSGSTYTYTFTGKGDYTGSLTRKVVVKKSAQDDLNSREVRINNMGTLRINGKYVDNVAYVDAKGVLEAPRVSVEDLAQNVDYKVDGFTDANGKAITKAMADEQVYVKLTGLGAYAGCTRLVDVMVVEGTISADLASSDVTFAVDGYSTYVDGKQTYYLLKNSKDNVHIKVRTANGYLLSPGQGYSLSKQVSSDQKSMTATFTGTDSRLFTGKTSVTFNLVDKYDISTMMESVSVGLVKDEANGASKYSSGFSEEGAVNYKLGSSDALPAAYTGYSYMPQLKWLIFKGGGQAISRSDFTTQLLNASGKSVTGITGAGKYTFVIKATGDEWTGTIKVPMVVTKVPSVSIANCACEVKATAAGKNPTVVLSAGSHTFTQGTDYTVSYGPNAPAGTRSWVKVSAVKGKGLTGSRVISYTVPGGASSKQLSHRDYDLTVGGYSNDIYTMAAFPGGSKPTISIRPKQGSVLDPKYYTVTYKDYDSFGLATVTVTGKNGYTGSMSANYLIVGVNLSKATSFVATGLGNVAYTGKAYTPDPVVTVDGVKLKKGTDYTLSYKNNTDAGTASVIITGKGNYSGSVTKTFKITGTNISTVTLGAVADQAYTGSAVKPAPTVKSGSKTLKAGTDYTLSYANNVNVGNKAAVTITGKGGYTGTKTVQFRIAFKDVSKSHWAYAKIHRANDLGLINGYSGSKTGGFGPSDNITRGQIAVMLWNVAGKPKASGGKAFPDVKSSAYYAKAVAWASSVGVVNGYANGKFGPDDNITREQLAVMVANYAKKLGGRKISGSKADIAKLSDASAVSGYAVPSVAWCYKNGAFVLQSGKINAKAKADRATAAQMAVDLYDLLH